MGRNTRLRLVFLPTLLSCSSRFLRALQQNRAQSICSLSCIFSSSITPLSSFFIINIIFINCIITLIIIFIRWRKVNIWIYIIFWIFRWLKAQFIFLFVVQHLQTNHQESRLQLHHCYNAISRHKLSWFYFLFLFKS